MTDANQQSINEAEAISILRSVGGVLREANPVAAAKIEELASSIESDVLGEAREARLHKYRSDLAAWEAKIKYCFDWRLESFKATMALAQRAITASMVVNAGAAIALLAYMGNTKATASLFINPLICFSSGVLIAAATFVFSYLSQLFYTNAEDDRRYRPWAIGFHWSTFVFGLISLSAFAGGIMATQVSFSKLQTVHVFRAETPEKRKNAPGPGNPGPGPAYPNVPAPSKPVTPPTKNPT